MEIKNALIVSTQLGKEDHGLFTFSIAVEYDSSGQSFGNYSLDDWSEKEKKRIGTRWGLELLMNILETVGVDNWEDLKGQYIRVEADNTHIERIGHIIKDKWFSPKELAEKFGIK